MPGELRKGSTKSLDSHPDVVKLGAYLKGKRRNFVLDLIPTERLGGCHDRHIPRTRYRTYLGPRTQFSSSPKESTASISGRQ